MRSKIFRQVVQKDRRLAVASQEIFVQHDENRLVQGVRRDFVRCCLKSAAKMICSMFVHSPVYRMGGDEFVVILSNTDYLNRSVIMKQLHDTSVENIKKGDVVVSAGISDYESGVTKNVKSTFEKADTLMYEEKKLLKSLGAETRL